MNWGHSNQLHEPNVACASLVHRRPAKSSRLCVGSGTGRPSGCLGGLLARRPLSALALIASGSVISWIASGKSACGHPTVSTTPEPSTAVFQVCCGGGGDSNFAVFSSIGRFVYSLSSPQQRPHVSVSAGPFGAAWTHNSTRTAVVFICVDLFIRYWQLNIGCSLSLTSRSHAHSVTHS